MKPDVLIIGAGAAGLMCAVEAGRRGRSVIVAEHSGKIAEKIRISGGGKCNFTNLHCGPDNFLSQNPEFCRPALRHYTQHDFIAKVERHGISYHEKKLGQLFCDRSANDIIGMFLEECGDSGVTIKKDMAIDTVSKNEDGFLAMTSQGKILAKSLVVATGGLSIPKIGATPFGYELAKQFGLNIIPLRAGLVPLVFDPIILQHTKNISGVSVDPAAVESRSGYSFDEALLFTHKGLSGPSILQISSYWKPGEEITVNFSPGPDILVFLKDKRKSAPRQLPASLLSEFLPKRLAALIIEDLGLQGNIADQSDSKLQKLAERIQSWKVKPSGSEGYKTAEVTLGGVDTAEISSETFESSKIPGLYFIGEVLDITGHLGGFNFQWAWSSGYCAGQYA